MNSTKVPEHTCGDSRLKCVDCSAQVCPSCFVACPVGNRCQKCSGGTLTPRGNTCSPGTAKKALSKTAIAKKAAPCLLFGALSGWLIAGVTFGPISVCFAIAFWAAGRETGSQMKRGDNELAYACLLPFVGGLILGTIGVFLYSGYPEVFIALLMNLAVMLFGFVLGRRGFG